MYKGTSRTDANQVAGLVEVDIVAAVLENMERGHVGTYTAITPRLLHRTN